MYNFEFKPYIHPSCTIAETLESSTQIVVVIPCFNETNLIETLQSLNVCVPFDAFEVVVVINDGELADTSIQKFNLEVYHQLLAAIEKQLFKYKIHAFWAPNLLHKIAGVGMARKIGMDFAAFLFKQQNTNGILACLDADCTVQPNYISTIIRFFHHHVCEAVSIHYEHPFPQNELLKRYIIDYELHLRYHINFQKWLKLPYAYQTIGSSMAVKVNAYLKEGGMNKRKAGEDFYFLHKFSMKGTLAEIKETTVLPSARMSDRVPFGTGKAMQDRQDGRDNGTYHPNSYVALLPLVQNIHLMYSTHSTIEDLNLPPSVLAYLKQENITEILQEIRANTQTMDAFIKRFYQWFNAFRLMKYLHFSRDNFYENVSVIEGARYLADMLNIKMEANANTENYLTAFRVWDVMQ